MSSYIIVLLTIFSQTFAQIQWSTLFSADLTYDQNIFYLSPSDLDKYRQRLEPLKFPYRSADDLDLMFHSELSGRFSKLTVLKAGLRIHNYTVNQEKSYGLLKFRLEQGMGNSHRLAVSYSWLPNYLIRYYRAANSQQYTPCRFGEHIGGISYQHKFGQLMLIPGYRFELYNYISPFEYYNTHSHRFNAELRWRPIGNFKLHTGYYFKMAFAKGPIPDISYNEHNIFVKLTAHPKRLYRFGLNPGYEYSRRYYTTPNPPAVDPYHSGRVDQIHQITIGADYLVNLITVYFNYELEWREIQSPYHGEIEEIKEYRTNRLRAGVKFPLKNKMNGVKVSGGENEEE